MQKFAIIGLGRFGALLAAKLTSAGHEVIAIDRNRRIIEEMRDKVTVAVVTDVTDDQALKAQGVAVVDAAVVGIGDDFEAAVLATVVLKKLGVARVVSRATTEIRRDILRRVGADEIVNPEAESADSWSVRLGWPQFLSHFELEPGFSVIEMRTPKPWVGQTLIELHPRANLGVQVVAVKDPPPDEADVMKVRMPRADQALEPGQVLMIMGPDEALAGLSKLDE